MATQEKKKRRRSTASRSAGRQKCRSPDELTPTHEVRVRAWCRNPIALSIRFATRGRGLLIRSQWLAWPKWWHGMELRSVVQRMSRELSRFVCRERAWGPSAAQNLDQPPGGREVLERTYPEPPDIIIFGIAATIFFSLLLFCGVTPGNGLYPTLGPQLP